MCLNQSDHSMKAKAGRLTLAVEDKTSRSLGFLSEVRHPPAGTVTPKKQQMKQLQIDSNSFCSHLNIIKTVIKLT